MEICHIVALMNEKDMLDTLNTASTFNLRKVKIYNWGQICVILPKAQVESEFRSVHISYFLQNCKKGKPC